MKKQIASLKQELRNNMNKTKSVILEESRIKDLKDKNKEDQHIQLLITPGLVPHKSFLVNTVKN
jgi:hypothetical protein